MITVESVPRNNPPRTEREKKINPSTPHQRQAFQRLQMYRSRPALPADCTIRLCAHSCPPHLKISLWSHLKTIISFPLVTLPPLASQRPTAMLTVFSRECFFFSSFVFPPVNCPVHTSLTWENTHFMWPSTMMHSHPQRQASSCVFHFPSTSQEEFSQHIFRKQISSFILVRSSDGVFSLLVLKYNLDVPHFQNVALSFVSTFLSINSRGH